MQLFFLQPTVSWQQLICASLRRRSSADGQCGSLSPALQTLRTGADLMHRYPPPSCVRGYRYRWTCVTVRALDWQSPVLPRSAGRVVMLPPSWQVALQGFPCSLRILQAALRCGRGCRRFELQDSCHSLFPYSLCLLGFLPARITFARRFSFMPLLFAARIPAVVTT